MNLLKLFLDTMTASFSPWVLGVLLLAAALAFLARRWAVVRHGRIREYRAAPLGMAAALGSLAVLYLAAGFIDIEVGVMRGVVRLFLSLLAAASILFNWGGVLTVWHDLRTRRE